MESTYLTELFLQFHKFLYMRAYLSGSMQYYYMRRFVDLLTQSRYRRIPSKQESFVCPLITTSISLPQPPPHIHKPRLPYLFSESILFMVRTTDFNTITDVVHFK